MLHQVGLVGLHLMCRSLCPDSDAQTPGSTLTGSCLSASSAILARICCSWSLVYMLILISLPALLG